MTPITREDVEQLICSDPDLSWSTSDYVDMKDGEKITRYYFIEWRGSPTSSGTAIRSPVSLLTRSNRAVWVRGLFCGLCVENGTPTLKRNYRTIAHHTSLTRREPVSVGPLVWGFFPPLFVPPAFAIAWLIITALLFRGPWALLPR
jgi:hypothetical protein